MNPHDPGRDSDDSRERTRTSYLAAERITFPNLHAYGASQWALLGQFLGQIISFLVLAVLYRLVGPPAFGVLALALAWVSLFRGLATLSWQAWLIQQPHWSDAELSQFFYGNLRVSVMSMLACMGLGGVVAWFYQVTGLALVVAGLSSTIVLSTLATFAQALHERRLNWRRLVFARGIAQGIAGVTAVACAWLGWGIVALVAQQCVEFGMLAWLLWRSEPWRPEWGHGSRLPAAAWRFQGWYALASLFFLGMQQVDTLVLGAWLGHSATGRALLGMYGQAYQLSQRPTYVLTGAWGSVLLAALSRAESKGAESAGASRLPIVQYFFGWTALLLMPVCVAGLFLAPDLMRVLGGEPWLVSGELLRIFAVLTFAQGIVNLAGNLFTVRGATRAMALGAGWGALLLGLGTIGACWASRGQSETYLVKRVAMTYVAVVVVWSVPYLVAATGVAQTPLLGLGQALGRSVVGGLAMALTLALIVAWLRDASPWVRLAGGVVSAGISYGLVLVPLVRQGAKELATPQRDGS